MIIPLPGRRISPPPPYFTGLGSETTGALGEHTEYVVIIVFGWDEVYIYICIYIYTCMYVCMYVYIYIHTYVYIYIYIHTYVYIYICIYIYITVYIYICKYVSTCISVLSIWKDSMGLN